MRFLNVDVLGYKQFGCALENICNIVIFMVENTNGSLKSIEYI